MKINMNNTVFKGSLSFYEKLIEKYREVNENGEITTCEECPYYYWCSIWDEDDDEDEAAFMVMIAVPGDGFDVIKDDTAEKEYPDLFPKGKDSKDLTSITGIEDVYYTFSTQSKRVMNGKLFVSSPVMIVKIDEEAGEFISPDAMDLYKAARFFEKRKTVIRTSDGRLIPVFCLD